MNISLKIEVTVFRTAGNQEECFPYVAAYSIKHIWFVGFAQPTKSLPLNAAGCLPP